MIGPKVSICIPTHNRPKFLKIALESIFLQSYQNYDICISDNSDNRHTMDLINKYKKNKIKYIKVSSLTGPVENQANAISLSNSRYLSFLGDDDFLEKSYLSELIKLRQKTKLSLIRSAGTFINSDGKKLNEFGNYYPIISGSKFIENRINQLFYSSLTGYLFTREDYLKSGGIIDVGFPGGLFSDDYLWFKLALLSKKVPSTNKKLWRWRMHPNNAGANIDIDAYINNVDYYIDLMIKLIPKNRYASLKKLIESKYKRKIISGRLDHELRQINVYSKQKRIKMFIQYLYFTHVPKII